MRTRPAAIPTTASLFAPSTPRRPQAPTALSTPSSPGLSSALFGWGPDRPRRARPPSPQRLPAAGAASPQQTSPVAEVTACQSAQPPFICIYALLHCCVSGCDLPHARPCFASHRRASDSHHSLSYAPKIHVRLTALIQKPAAHLCSALGAFGFSSLP